MGNMMKASCTALLTMLCVVASNVVGGAQATAVVPGYEGKVAEAAPGRQQIAVLAGGCFWGVQGVFQHVKGVSRAQSGYAGGEAADATYDQVSFGTTAHAEVVQVTFDPAVISYARILQIFFSVAHDPTQLDRQGPDVGTQYRSAVFPVGGEQARIAREYIAQLNRMRVFDTPIVTKIESGWPFYPAEVYHQDFMMRNPRDPYIVAHDLPKLAALKQLFPDDYRSEPVLVRH
jgi:peptide-methionine (S)-S-oxide reductase